MTRVSLSTLAIALLLPSVAAAQHEGHQMTAAADDRLALAQCAQVQPVVGKLIDGAAARLEEARMSNSPAALRAAADDFAAVLRDLRAQLTPCATLPEVDPHAGHSDPHAGHTMPAAKPAAPPKPPPPDRIDRR